MQSTLWQDLPYNCEMIFILFMVECRALGTKNGTSGDILCRHTILS